METVRVIVCSTENGNSESITFTDDFDSPAGDWCAPGWSVDIDQKIDMEVPSGFPLCSTFTR